MVTDIYVTQLQKLIEDGIIEERLVDEAVTRILQMKNRLGLFENPYRFADSVREPHLLRCPEHRKLAKKAAMESFVLLKNDGILPLDRQSGKICFAGPYVDEKRICGSWSFQAEPRCV